MAIVFVLGWVFARRSRGPGWVRAACLAEGTRAGLTIEWEFLLGHSVFGF